jgi:Sporulation and spore germination
MASPGPGPARRWLARARRAFVVTAVAASVAGCVGMPNSGSPGTFSATPQNTTPDSDFIGAIPAGPEASWSPSQVVEGFLNASASYPVYSAIAREYLVGSASKAWDPGWSVRVVDQVDVPGQAGLSQDRRQATVDVTGTVRASFNGTGQYVGAQQSRGAGQGGYWQAKLVKVGHHWLITNPPEFRMLTEPTFAKVYKPQDLYFFDSTGEVLVPDAVFVPAGTSPASLVSNLVNALLKNPQTGWLQSEINPMSPAVTEFPGGTGIDVAVDGTTATVNLTGAAVAGTTATTREQISAQLVWTLTAQQAAPPNIEAVQLEINGKPWIPANPPCPGGAQSQSPAQKLAMYSCKNPYPPANSQAFYYVANGQAWSRCASEAQVTTGSIGTVLPVFSRTSRATLSQSCRSSVLASSPAVPPSQPRGVPPLSMIAVSPDSKYAAGVSPNGNIVDIWVAGGTKPAGALNMPGVTAIGWDRRDYLWVTQGDSTSVIAQAGDNKSVEIPNSFPGKLAGLSIAPDGVRVAAIVQTDAGPELQLAAIDSGAPPSASGQLASPLAHTSIGPAVQLGPNVTNPIALTWYDADDLLVLDGTGNGTTLWEVPVDGQPATKLAGVLSGAISITANSSQNALVVGLTGGRMEVSASLEGPWQPLGSGGQHPAFQVPVSSVTAQS